MIAYANVFAGNWLQRKWRISARLPFAYGNVLVFRCAAIFGAGGLIGNMAADVLCLQSYGYISIW